MVSISFQTIVLAIIQILLLGLVGFTLIKSRIIDEGGLDQLMRLLIKLFIPAFTFYYLIVNFHFQEFPDWWWFILYGCALTLGSYLLSFFLTAGLRKFSYRNHLRAVISFQNSGTLPLLIVTALFAKETMIKFYIYIFFVVLGFQLLLWTLGVFLINTEKDLKMDFRKLLNPPFLSIVLTLIFIAIGGQRIVPQLIINPLKMISDCCLPLAMIVVGGNMAYTRLKDVQFVPIALCLLGKLVLVPAVALLIILSLRLNFSTGLIILIEAAVPTAVSLTIMARYYKIDDTFINQATFFSHITSVLTIPVFLTLYAHLAGN